MEFKNKTEEELLSIDFSKNLPDYLKEAGIKVLTELDIEQM